MTQSHSGRARNQGPIASSAYKLKPDDQWTPHDLRDYIIAQITMRDAASLASPQRVVWNNICTGFINRYGAALAVAIARFAFERMDGVVTGRRVHFGRFTRKADPYFAEEIIKMLPPGVVNPPADAA